MDNRTCVWEGCEEQLEPPRRKWCDVHQMKARSETVQRLRRNETRTCTKDECASQLYSRGMCRAHYKRTARVEGFGYSPTDLWGERRKANYRKRRAAKRGATSPQPIVHTAVYERDKWTCQLCELPVDPSLSWPHPMSASLDHRQPLSKGGAHDLSNVQCSHLVCNMRKGNRDTGASLATLGGTPL